MVLLGKKLRIFLNFNQSLILDKIPLLKSEQKYVSKGTLSSLLAYLLRRPQGRRFIRNT